MTTHRAQPTDCIHSIAARYGHLWETIWNHDNNKELRAKREVPTCLQEGDEVFIPEPRLKKVQLATHKLHRFRRKRVPLRLKLTLRDEYGEPRSALDYEIEVARTVHKGKTDSDGRLDVPIPPAAIEAVLRIFEPDAESGVLRLTEEHRLVIGGLDPAGSIKGAQARLRNMGFYHGPVDGDFGRYSQEALQAFQRAQGLNPTGEIDDDTRAALIEEHKR